MPELSVGQMKSSRRTRNSERGDHSGYQNSGTCKSPKIEILARAVLREHRTQTKTWKGLVKKTSRYEDRPFSFH